jgi:hypothetical protein
MPMYGTVLWWGLDGPVQIGTVRSPSRPPFIRLFDIRPAFRNDHLGLPPVLMLA